MLSHPRFGYPTGQPRHGFVFGDVCSAVHASLSPVATNNPHNKQKHQHLVCYADCEQYQKARTSKHNAKNRKNNSNKRMVRPRSHTNAHPKDSIVASILLGGTLFMAKTARSHCFTCSTCSPQASADEDADPVSKEGVGAAGSCCPCVEGIEDGWCCWCCWCCWCWCFCFCFTRGG